MTTGQALALDPQIRQALVSPPEPAVARLVLDGNPTPTIALIDSATGAFSIQSPALADGSYEVRIRAERLDGTASTPSAPVTVRLDNYVPPTPPPQRTPPPHVQKQVVQPKLKVNIPHTTNNSQTSSTEAQTMRPCGKSHTSSPRRTVWSGPRTRTRAAS